VFRGKVFQQTLSGNSYRIFIEGLKSPVTKAAYSFALQKYMNHLKIGNPDELLIHQENPKIVQDQIIEYLIQLKNPPHSLRYATRSQYLAAIMTFYDLNEVVLNKKKSIDIWGKKKDRSRIAAIPRKKYLKCLRYAMKELEQSFCF
jgi:hypothetical protein